MCPKQQSFKISVTVVLEKDTVGYHASCPGFKGLHVTGKSKKEALENVKEAISCYLLSLIKHGDPIPFGPDFTIEYEPLPEAWMIHKVEMPWPTQSLSGIS